MVYFPIMRHSRKKNTKTFSSIENISNEGFQLKKRLKPNDDGVPLIREITWEKACKKLLFKTTKPWCRFGAKVIPVLMACPWKLQKMLPWQVCRYYPPSCPRKNSLEPCRPVAAKGRGLAWVCGHLGNEVRAVCEYDRGLPGKG